MRKLWYWYLPVLLALVATSLFGWGFYSFLRGDIGSRVDLIAPHALDARSTTGQVSVLVLGDSLAKGTGDSTGLGFGGRLERDLKQRNRAVAPTVNLAVNGARTGDLMQQLQSRNVLTLVAQANVIVISIGGNDLWGGSDFRNAAPRDPEGEMARVLDHIESIYTTVRGANPNARIFLIGLYNPFIATPLGKQLDPFVKRWNSKLLERFAQDPNFTVVQTYDIFSHEDRLSFDRFHPGDEGYALIASRIAESM
jgi:lysophospholipase L1-like esterase